MKSKITAHDRMLGCMLGGAVGDAMGAPVEFKTARMIGPAVLRYRQAYGRLGAITDDTQMTLFTAEGLLRQKRSGRDMAQELWLAYRRWLMTQSFTPVRKLVATAHEDAVTGWLVKQRFLWNRRAPGATCLSALNHGSFGSVKMPPNDSKGCGGVMRTAPCAFTDEPFANGIRAAALTHGHPDGYFPAGAYAQILSEIMRDSSLTSAVRFTIRVLDSTAPEAAGTMIKLAQALALFADGEDSAKAIKKLGGGWVGEEALAVGVYCALLADDFRDGVSLAVTHDGDSDSTGSIAGAILGTLNGASSIPGDLLAGLEGRDTIERITDDMYNVFINGDNPPKSRYPR